MTENFKVKKVLLAAHPEKPPRITSVHIASRHRIETGGETKERIKGIVRGARRDHHVNLIRRNFQDNWPWPRNPFENTVLLTMKNWKMYRDAGLPTYNTLRIAQDGSLLVTDECADGSRTYGNPDLWSSLKFERAYRNKEDSVIDDIFIGLISSAALGLIKQRAEEITALATDKLIGLPGHDPLELIVRPNSVWELKTLDVAESRLYKDDYFGRYEVRNHNESCAREFVDYLQKTRDEIIAFRGKTFYQKFSGPVRHKLKKFSNRVYTRIKYGQ
jgi:hypothetical protein